MNEFVEKYPKSEHVDQIYTCLANTYLNSYNYNEAIRVLEKSSFSDDNVKNQYQKICFYRGVQLYNDGLYHESIIYFDKAISVAGNNKLLYESYYWKAESHYNLSNFSNALTSYDKLKKDDSLYLNSLYAQGYCFLKNGKYKNAINKFKTATKHHVDTNVLHDIYVRIGDCYFLLMNYEASANFYNKALKTGGFQDDYAAYKKALLMFY